MTGIKQKDTRMKWFLLGLALYLFAFYGIYEAATGLIDMYQWRSFESENNCTETGKRILDLTGENPFSVTAWSGKVYLCDSGRWQLDTIVVR